MGLYILIFKFPRRLQRGWEPTQKVMAACRLQLYRIWWMLVNWRNTQTTEKVVTWCCRIKWEEC